MTESIGTGISEFLAQYLPPELIAFIVSMIPLLELRIGLGVAKVMGVAYPMALLVCVLGTMIPIPFIVFFIRKVLAFLQQHGPIKRFATWIEAHGTRKGEEFEKKHPTGVFLGLILFVAIPIPGTGAWSGSLVAALLGINPKHSIPALCLGVVGSAAIMSFIWYGIPAIANMLGS